MKKIIIPLAVVALLLGIAYAVSWHIWARGVAQAVETFRANITAQGAVIHGTFTRPAGFPGPISISFSGTIQSDGRALAVPMITARGFFLPGTRLHIGVPQGLRLQLPDRDLYTSSIDAAVLDVTVPNPLPADFTARDLNRWREAGGRLDIHELSLRKGDLNVKGTGVLSLDERLQPLLQMPAEMTGHMAFLLELQQRNLVTMQQAMIAGAAMGALSKPGKGDVPTVNANISIQRSTLYVGPIRIVDVPPVFWPE